MSRRKIGNSAPLAKLTIGDNLKIPTKLSLRYEIPGQCILTEEGDRLNDVLTACLTDASQDFLASIEFKPYHEYIFRLSITEKAINPAP